MTIKELSHNTLQSGIPDQQFTLVRLIAQFLKYLIFQLLTRPNYSIP